MANVCLHLDSLNVALKLCAFPESVGWAPQVGKHCSRSNNDLFWDFNQVFCMIIYFYYRIPLCALINKHLSALAKRFPATKFIRSISNTCIPNYPDKNLPTIFVYSNGQMKGQIIGAAEFRYSDLSEEGLKWTFKNLIILFWFNFYLNDRIFWVV